MFNKISNYFLIKRFPFLLPRMIMSGDPVRNFDYSWTELDQMPKGWRKAFGIKMCKEIKKALVKNDALDEYMILQIKEKYGELRWYDSGAPREVYDIINKYSLLSRKTCIECGKPATLVSTGWISPFCDNCAKKINGELEPIDIFYKEGE